VGRVLEINKKGEKKEGGVESRLPALLVFHQSNKKKRNFFLLFFKKCLRSFLEMAITTQKLCGFIYIAWSREIRALELISPPN